MVRSTLRRLVRRLAADARVRALLVPELARTHPLLSSPQLAFAPPGHFYSPLPDPALVDGAAAERLYAPPGDDGVELRLEAQLGLLRELAPFVREFDWPEARSPERRYWLRNGFYEHGDAAVLYAMLRRFAPRRVIEVGSGFSSALMLDANERLGGGMQLTFIEPFPDRLRALLRPGDEAAARILAAPVQEVPTSIFDALEANDVLFIDSSHVVKLGSDVNHLLFAVLPRLRPGVLVHVHDVFYPFEYPPAWIREGRAWNETYALRAFLQYNSAFEVLLFNDQLAQQHPQEAAASVPQLRENAGGALWMRRTGR